MYRLLKTKHLSFATLIVYLVWIFPATTLCIEPDWLDRPEQQTVYSVSQLTSVAQPLKHHVFSDDDEDAIVQLDHAVFVFVVYPSGALLASVVSSVFTLHFSARAPPAQLT
jgi:hypothetical protein